MIFIANLPQFVFVNESGAFSATKIFNVYVMLLSFHLEALAVNKDFSVLRSDCTICQLSHHALTKASKWTLSTEECRSGNPKQPTFLQKPLQILSSSNALSNLSCGVHRNLNSNHYSNCSYFARHKVRWIFTNLLTR